jgi:MFS family permease
MHLDRKLSRVFYGWWIVGASCVVAVYTGGAVVYGFTAIFEPIANELGWSYTQISLAASLRGLEIGILAPFTGVLADRWGTRRLIFGGAAVIALGLVLLSHTTSLAMFYGAYLLIAIGNSGCGTNVLMTAVANWFRKKVGIASGIAVSGFGLAGLLIPVTVRLIEIYNWRIAMTILAMGILGIILPLSLLFRHKPEQYGLWPDGEVEGAAILGNVSAPPRTIEVSVGAKQALRTSTFWHIALAFTCHTMVSMAVVTHVMPYLGSIGVARSTSSLVATAVPLTSIGGRLGLGWLGDRIDRRKVAAIAFGMIVFGTLCFGSVSTVGAWMLVPFVIFFGIGYGGTNVMRTSTVREFFGRANFGSVLGVVIGINMIGNIVGPPLAGWVFDTRGSYQAIWFVFAGLGVAALISMLRIHPVSSSG